MTFQNWSFSLHRMKKQLFAKIALLSCLAGLLAACDASAPSISRGASIIAAKPQPSGMLDLAPIASLTASNRSEVPGIVRRFVAADLSPSRRVRINDVDLFLSSTLGKSYIQAPTSKALAIGVPAESCPRYQTAEGATPPAAVENALNQCLGALSGIMAGDKPCSCQVVAVDGTLLVQPIDLPFRRRLPAHLVWIDNKGDVRRQIAFADLNDQGPDRAIQLSTADGRKFCSGTINGTAQSRADAQSSRAGAHFKEQATGFQMSSCSTQSS